jgi:hypothetical protein
MRARPIDAAPATRKCVGTRRDSDAAVFTRRHTLDKQEITKLQAYMRLKFKLPEIKIVARPKKKDSAEVFIGDEFIGVMYRDDEDGEVSWNFQMAILEMDLDG